MYLLRDVSYCSYCPSSVAGNTIRYHDYANDPAGKRFVMSGYKKTKEQLVQELKTLQARDSSPGSSSSHATDVTVQQRTQEALRENETRLASIIDTAMDAIVTVDEAQTIILFNRAAERVFKCSSSEAVGQSIDRFIPGRVRKAHREHIQQFGKTEDTPRSMGKLGTLLAVRANGEEFPIEASISQAMVRGKKLFTVILRDITEQKESEQLRARTERIIRENEERYRIVIEQTGKLVYDYDVPTGAIRWSGAVKPVTGFSVEEFQAVDIKRWEHMIHPDDREQALALLVKAMADAGTYNFHYRFCRKDGSYIYVQDTGTFLTDDQGKPYRMLGTMGDVTEQVNAEQALRESEERYRQFFEDDLTGDFISKADGQIISCNPAFLRIFGFTSVEEALSTNTADLYPSADARRAYLDLLRTKKKLEYYEAELRRRDGKPVYVVETVIGSFDESGQLLELKGYIFDNSERKKLEEQLLQSQKMEAVGQLANGIAHDFNNVMGVVLTASNLLRMKSSDPDISRYAKMIEEATLRGAAIAKQLLQFSRAEAGKLAPVSLSQTVLDAKKFLDHSFPKTIAIDVRIALQHGLVMADAGQIHQMILNLCINARDAILERTDRPSGGRIIISLEPASGQFIEDKYGWKSAEHYVLLSIADDGKGISDDTRRRIFDPFFTTKGIGKGTGLGLSIVHGIVKAHNAIIDVETREGTGTTFLVYLPAIKHQAIKDTPRETEHIRGHGETILIIEDEPLLRDLLKECLMRAGYSVMEAGDGEEGIMKYEENINSIDLVFSDIGLPKLGGEQAFEAMRKMNPRAKVVLCTGFIEEEAKATLRKAGAVGILHKPYNVQEVLSAAREALDAS
jgi:two-component system, cell cycle sensor histidine kinase and response regulator CckA